ncbi:MAG: hypothetical protein DHS20C14_12800 [Phycisphaeraceae bacterium]|nr:MAG: hypothetical protein DHS20C14_12800 [Phycisphaeraceae bacterium]
MTRGRVIMMTVVGLALGVGAWYIAELAWLAPAREIRTKIAGYERVIASADSVLAGRATLRDRTERLGATMIAGKPDEFEHRLRAGLASVAQGSGLTQVASGNGRPSPTTSPAARRAGRTLGSRLRAEPDFAVVHAWVAGTGTLEQVIGALASVQSQPWVHRVEGYSIRPEGENRFKLRVDLASVRMDSVRRTIEDPTALVAPSDETRALAASVVAAHPFGAPPPAPDAGETRVTEAPRGPRYDRWRVTGLIEGERVEALLFNAASGERRVLAPGERVLDATFAGGAGEQALFTINGQDHEVTVGQTLGERRPTPTDPTSDETARVSVREAGP